MQTSIRPRYGSLKVQNKKESVEQLVIETRASRMQSERSTTELQPLWNLIVTCFLLLTLFWSKNNRYFPAKIKWRHQEGRLQDNPRHNSPIGWRASPTSRARHALLPLFLPLHHNQPQSNFQSTCAAHLHIFASTIPPHPPLSHYLPGIVPSITSRCVKKWLSWCLQMMWQKCREIERKEFVLRCAGSSFLIPNVPWKGKRLWSLHDSIGSPV